MSDGDALLSAILAQPDEDVPRLAFADWLDEHGTPAARARAEFVRVQVALARSPAGSRPADLVGREKYLLELHREEWLAPLQGDDGPLPRTVAHGQFRRGFVEVVWMSVPGFVTRAETLFTRAPVRELRVAISAIAHLESLVGCDHFPRLSALDLTAQGCGDALVRVLTRRQAVATLARIRLRGCGLTDAGAVWLAGAGFDWPLTELDVTHNALGPVGLSALRDRFGFGVVRCAGG